jgi:hypothetical protein
MRKVRVNKQCSIFGRQFCCFVLYTRFIFGFHKHFISSSHAFNRKQLNVAESIIWCTGMTQLFSSVAEFCINLGNVGFWM